MALKKKDWMLGLMVVNILIIVLIIWFAWIRPPKDMQNKSVSIKVEEITMEQPKEIDVTMIKKEEEIKPAKKEPAKKTTKKTSIKKEKIGPEKSKGKGIYGVLSDTYSNPSLKFDVANPGDNDGGYLGAWGSARIEGNIPDAHTDPPGSLKVNCNGGWGGIWLQFGFDPSAPPGESVNKDMSQYGEYLRFDIKTNGEVGFGVEWWDDTANSKDSIDKKIKQDLNVPTDNKWYAVKINLKKLTGKNFKRGINFKKVRLPVSFFAENSTFYVDNIRWEK